MKKTAYILLIAALLAVMPLSWGCGPGYGGNVTVGVGVVGAGPWGYGPYPYGGYIGGRPIYYTPYPLF